MSDIDALVKRLLHKSHPLHIEAAKVLQEQAAQIDALKDAVDKDLSARMEAAGMIPLDATTKPDCLTSFNVHSGMVDLDFFAEWLERKAREYVRMQAAHQTGERPLKDDMFDFILGKAGAFKEVLENYRAAAHGDPVKSRADALEAVLRRIAMVSACELATDIANAALEGPEDKETGT